MYKNALKEDLIRVVEDLDGTVESTDTIVKLKTKIENSSTFESDPDFVKTLIQNCIDERVSRNERESQVLSEGVEGEERWEASDHPQRVLGGIEPNRSITCMVLKATANDRRHLALCHDEFRGPRSGLCQSDGIMARQSRMGFGRSQEAQEAFSKPAFLLLECLKYS
ncbi:zinc finger protein [Trichonephila clavipes]|nr:zinc finger protein [Trichonephila clavipes]